MAVKALIIRTAGTNCDFETEFAFRMAGADAERLHINRLKKNPGLLDDFDMFVIAGGFSYGDDLGAGTILANELTTRLRPQVEHFLAAGKMIIGICNGFQVLVKTGLLPGIVKWRRDVTLAANDSHRFEARWVYLKSGESCSGLLMRDELIYLPVAHAEGKLILRNESLLNKMEENGQIIFRYCSSEGKPAGYPDNPNGSVGNIAGICDPTGRVIGMMPHPERYCMPYQHPAWTREEQGEQADGLEIFRRALSLACQNAGSQRP